jgi:hypothetical protein
MDKDMEDYNFLLEMQALHHQMELIIEKYNFRDRVMSVVVTGLLDPIDDETSSMKALFSYNLSSQEEVKEITDFIENTYEEREKNGDDLDDLLGDLGISLN